MGGLGYGGLDLERIEAAFARHDAVERWTGLGFTNAISLDGEPVLAVVGFDERSATDVITVAEGRLPLRSDEIALGRETARRRGIEVGDSVTLTSSDIDDRQSTVTGIVVLPSLGSIGADRAGPGTGMLVPAAAFSPALVELMVSFLGIDVAPGSDRGRVVAELTGELAAADMYNPGNPPFTYVQPVRPPEIVDATSMRHLPMLVGVVMVLTATVGLSATVLVSVRIRRRDIATLRALGLTGRQIRRSVRVQALCSTMAGLVVGVPVGLIVGRMLWRAYAEQLGVVPEPPSPWLIVAATVAGGAVVALLAAQLPARVASRARPASGLRSE